MKWCAKKLTANCSDGHFHACMFALSKHTKEGLNMLFPLHNSSSFQSNLMTGQFFFVLRLQQIVSQKLGATGLALLFCGV